MRIAAALLSSLALATGPSAAEAPPLLNFQGKLTDPVGAPVPDGTYEIRFRVYSDATGSSGDPCAGSCVWEETQQVLTEAGVYSVLLGSLNPLEAPVFSGGERWVGVKVGADPEMSPRHRVASVPYALQANRLAAAQGSEANVKDFGAVGDGVTDDTAAVLAAIASLATSGGVVVFPVGKYRITQQIVLPNDGAAENTRQPPLILRGAGALFDGRGGEPNGGTILDLRVWGVPKIATYGLGLLEAEDITFADYTISGAPILYTTNTTLHIHDCGFYGGYPGTQATNDAIILGGTDAVSMPGGPDPDSGFQGYGTVIRDNYFGRIRRAIYGRVFANNIAVIGNTIWNSSGTNLPGGAAIDLQGNPEDTTNDVNVGWYVAGNLIEISHYAYGIKCDRSQRNVFLGNGFFDPTGTSVAGYRFEESCRLNFVLPGYRNNGFPLVEDMASGNWRSTVLDYHQNRESLFPQKVRFQNRLYLEPGVASPSGPRVVSPTGAELDYQLLNDHGMLVSYTPGGGSSIPLWKVVDEGSGTIVHELQGSDAKLRNQNGAVSVQTREGDPLVLGEVSGRGVRVTEGALEFSPASTRILSGAGPPAEAAPDGSLYLRTDGGPGSTLYVREAGAWVAK